MSKLNEKLTKKEIIDTGTGKTGSRIAMMDVFMRAGWAESVLFLVDKIAPVTKRYQPET